MTIGESIKKARKSKGLTQAQLGEATGISQYQISWWETGRIYPHILSCLSLADALNISLDELVGRSVKGGVDKDKG